VFGWKHYLEAGHTEDSHHSWPGT